MNGADANACRAWPLLHGMPVPAGAIVVGLGGEVLRILEDGGVEEIRPAVPNRRGVLVDLKSLRTA